MRLTASAIRASSGWTVVAWGMVERMAHFAVAFFGYHLQAKSEYRHYFSEDFVSQFRYLKWGVYVGL